MAGNVYFFTKMTDETGTESLTDRRADGTVSSKEPGSRSPDHSEKAHRNGNARFTIFTKDEDIEIKWLKSKFFCCGKFLKITIFYFLLKLTFLNDMNGFIFIDWLLSCGEIFSE